MRVCLVTHGFPPRERTGVENYTASLASALVRAGHAVEVFSPRSSLDLPQLSLRREVIAGYGVSWITANLPPRDAAERLDVPGMAERFGRFLDHERPDVVHFQHFVKLGVGLQDEARERGIPTVYTAHDYYAICHRYTLMRPDLSRCDVLGDSMACARCDLALAWLDRKDGLGDYQTGVLSDQLGQEELNALRALLADDPEPAGISLQELDDAFDARLALDGRRHGAYSSLDLILAPTRFLADRLIEGGLDPERIEVLSYGIESGDLARVPPLRARKEGAVRFGYLGSLSKHKGVHNLIEAFQRLDVPAELSISGYSSDEPYVERLRAQAAEAGVIWSGGYERADLPRSLEGIDVVVVPSTWVENQPLVIREAFAAGRPVITGRHGALAESVRDGVDGLLVDVEDPDALAEAMARCVREEGLIDELARGIEPVKDVEEQAQELVSIYRRLARVRKVRAGLPASLQRFAARYDELAELPSRELFSRALTRLGLLRSGLGGASASAPAEEVLGLALAGGTRVQTLLQDLTNETAWREELVEGEKEEIRALRRERDWLRGLAADKDRIIGIREEEIAWLRGKLSFLDEVEKEGRHLTAHLQVVAELGQAALEAQQHLLGEEVSPLLEILERAVQSDQEKEEPAGPSADTQVLASLIHGLRLGATRLAELEERLAERERELAECERQLAWRSSEMEGAVADSDRRLARLLIKRTGLGRRMEIWRRILGQEGGSQ